MALDALLNFTARISQPGAHHYIIESLVPETARTLNEFTARELTAQLTAAESYLIITVDNRVPIDRDILCRTVAWHNRPDPVEALRRHLTFYLSDTAAEKVLRQLPMTDLQPHLAEREMRLTDRLARRVSQAHQDGTSLDDAISSLGLGARRQIEDWFSKDPSISDVSFLLACAVLGGCAYSTVSTHAAQIEHLLAEVSRVELTQNPQPLTRSRSERLSAVMAKLGSGLVNTEFGASVTETVALESTPLVRAILDVVWHEYPLIVEALLLWILEAGDDRDADVRVRVAFAAGQLAEYDFTTVRGRLLLPWAKSERVGPRGTAAFALGVPAATDTTAGQVLGLLHHWATVRNPGLVWTATEAYGSYVGLMFPHIAMSELLSVVIHGDGQSADVTRSVRRLFLLGGRQDPTIAPVVLAGLVDWLQRDLRPAPQVARCIFVDLLTTAGSPQQWDARAVYAQLTNEPSRVHASALLGRCLAHKDSQPRTLEALRRLLAVADTDQDINDSLQELVVAAVVTDPPDPRALQRMAFHLNLWQSRSRTSLSAGRLLTRILKETQS